MTDWLIVLLIVLGVGVGSGSTFLIMNGIRPQTLNKITDVDSRTEIATSQVQKTENINANINIIFQSGYTNKIFSISIENITNITLNLITNTNYRLVTTN